jgi:hypothetical protein
MTDTEKDDRAEALDGSKTEESERENQESGEPESNKKKKKKSKKKKKKKSKSASNGPDDETSDEKLGEASATDKKEPKTIANSDDDDDDNDDEDLLAAAALWAGDDAEDEGKIERPPKESAQNTLTTPRKSLSLHITQLPYDSTEFDLRKLFAEQGCSVTSIRLVYDHDTEGRKTVFRGVAFIDLLDPKSYDEALKLHHKTTIRGRRLNIRPCRTKEELAGIVARTQELVQEKIRLQRSGEAGDSNIQKPSSTSSKPKSSNNKNSNNTKRKNTEKDRKNKKPRLDKDGKAVKLTKKERNRRAAIIMQKKRRQNK